MENEETHIDEHLKEAFNNGYLIGKHRQELAKSLQESYTKNPAKENVGILSMLIDGIGEGTKAIKHKSEVEKGFEEIRNTRKDNEEEKELSPDIE